VKDPDAPGEISINPDTLKTVAASSNDFINPVNYVTKNSVTFACIPKNTKKFQRAHRASAPRARNKLPQKPDPSTKNILNY
jgi:hypothetical protein